jgi:predicted glycoside hydrolase/deacetylase ChbG (UPF0249 family)
LSPQSTQSQKKLIVNADALGRSADGDAAIFRAHREGILTSASVMVNGVSTPAAVAEAKGLPHLGLGLHLTFTEVPPVLPTARIPTMVDSHGILPARPEALVAADSREVLAEAHAQLGRFRGLVGRLPTHFDSHHHAHRLPAVFEALVVLAWETGAAVRSTSPEMRDRLRDERVATTDRFIEGVLKPDFSIERLLAEVGLGLTEIGFLPVNAEDSMLLGLAQPEARHAVQAAGIRLVHYGSL